MNPPEKGNRLCVIANSQVLKAKVALAPLLSVHIAAHLRNEVPVDEGAQQEEGDTAQRTDQAAHRVAPVTVKYCTVLVF